MNGYGSGASVQERVKAVLGGILGQDLVADITEDTGIVNELGLDSIQMITFLLRIEDEFDLELDFESLELAQLDSVRQFCEFVTADAHQQHQRQPI
ncbi:acyl carrier protein [Streptomyces sp. 3213]|uniref:acyl carrier protein n=1 Tax=Streptomyces sp. 3213.3 TaxID=1855348 RepID=UPI0008953A3D|nr:acyl carrier protein [Streptomyces sp. 3213.3]SEC30925.1 acyl carrier protein [Streptomyces sp. 3213] [Streptomyces sp. 3213.3]